jgi:hypothetical protein
MASRPTAWKPKKRLTRSRNLRREMLDLDRGRALDAEHQRARFRRFAIGRARPLHLERLRMRRDFRPDDIRPARHEFGGGKALARKAACQQGIGQISQWTGKASGLVHARGALSDG